MKKILTLASAAALVATASFAQAQSGRVEYRATSPAARSEKPLPNRAAWASRNMTPNRMQLQILAGPTSLQALSIRGGFSTMQGGPSEFGLNVRHYRTNWQRSVTIGPITATERREYSSTQTSLPIGIAFSPINNLEVGLALPFQFGVAADHPARYYDDEPTTAFGDLPIWATYQLKDGPVQIGVRVAVFLPTQTDVQVQAGLPVLYRNGKVRVDSGLFFHFTANDPTVTELLIPMRVGFQITPEVYAGFQTGLNLGFTDGTSNITMPLFGFVGYTLPTSMGPIDLGLRFGFDQFAKGGTYADGTEYFPANVRPDNVQDGGGIDLNDFSMSLGANVALQF